jgi:ADP-ribosylglycohydrolase
MALDKDNVRGLMIGCGVGDAMGMPVEGMDMRLIRKTHGTLNYLMNHPMEVRVFQYRRHGGPSYGSLYQKGGQGMGKRHHDRCQ